MAKIEEWAKKEKYSVLFTIIVIALVGFLYFGIEGNAGGMGSTIIGTNLSIFEGMKTKVAYTENGGVKVFAESRNNLLSSLKTTKGNPIPEINSMVVGEEEANMMEKENLFSKVGDRLNDFFGINTTIEGTLAKTNTPLDYMHFLSAEEFTKIKGEENKYYVLVDGTDTEPIFRMDLNSSLPKGINLSEGKMADYTEHQIVGKTYYPVIIGFDDANEMRKQKEFSKLGDTIEIAGKEFIVIGVLQKTNSILDMAHLVPLDANELKEGA